MKAECPVHGLREFIRDDECRWSYCDMHNTRSSRPLCSSVIPDEHLTPDGGDVIQWYAHNGTCWKCGVPRTDVPWRKGFRREVL